jgi:DNA invertase Pin-like site-specific DNA recombinase
VICEHPNITTFFLHLLSCFAEEERRQISERTRLALQEAKKRGVELGKNGGILGQVNKRNKEEFVSSIRTSLELVRQECTSLSEMSRRLNEMNVPTYRNGRWYPQTVKNYLANDMRKLAAKTLDPNQNIYSK